MGKREWAVVLATVIFAGVGDRCLQGEIITYSDFSDISALTLNGTATQIGSAGDARIRIIGGGCLSGSFFADLPVEIGQFSTRFIFQITGAGGWQDPTGSPGGDGFTFAIQPVGPTALGNGGGWLGFEGIGSGVAVEFDTHKGPDQTFDPSSNHIGIDINNVRHTATNGPTVTVTPSFDDGEYWHAWIDYNGTSLEVRTNTSDVRPTLPTLSYNLSLPNLLGMPSAYVGFTGGTCIAYGKYDIVAWDFEGAPAVPEPATIAIWSVLGALGMIVARRRNCSALQTAFLASI